ncbi:hypothetical protein ACF1AB_35100 [Streptomyces sp. NPDC014846]|uniref:hypothetical protein n=1 Tax=Streptomyces sp. NPDC014846 TaxID=3364922 RepID=UPI003700F546
MSDILSTTPAATALSAACEQAYQAAITARRALLDATTAYAAHLIREALPDAAAITVDVEDKELYEVLDARGTVLWHAPDVAGHVLSAGIVDDIDALLCDAIPFGGLVGAGWETAARGLPYRTVALPGGLLPEPCTPGLEPTPCGARPIPRLPGEPGRRSRSLLPGRSQTPLADSCCPAPLLHPLARPLVEHVRVRKGQI